MHSRPLEILLVEDNPGDIRLTREAFKEGRIATTLHVTHNGDEGMAYLNRCCKESAETIPDLVLLDWNLPRRNGREVLQSIRENPKLRDLPVIVMSSSNAEQDIHDAYRLRANCYVIKPGDYEIYVKMIRSIEQFWSRFKSDKLIEQMITSK
jgi:CheY-like chemotaxis protein